MSLEREVGELAGKVEGLEDDVREIKEDVKAIRSSVDKAKGSWALLLGLAAISSAFGWLMSWIFSHIGPR